jgi:hypothetical protein
LNNGRKSKHVKLPGFQGKITLRKVVSVAMKEQVHEKTKEMSRDAEPGTRKWLGYYSRALANIVANLDDDEVNEMEKLREQWEKNGIPPKVQAE